MPFCSMPADRQTCLPSSLQPPFRPFSIPAAIVFPPARIHSTHADDWFTSEVTFTTATADSIEFSYNGERVNVSTASALTGACGDGLSQRILVTLILLSAALRLTSTTPHLYGKA